MKNINLIFIILFFSACTLIFTEEDLHGIYVPVNYKNSFDTIQLKPNGIYYRKVYDKNKKLVLKMNGKWNLEKINIIHFDSFFLNFDRDMSLYPELLQDTLGGGGGALETKNKAIQFCIGYHEGENCYQKIK